MLTRKCLFTNCNDSAVATLTYVYEDATIVIGPISTQAEPSGYDLCERHALTMTAPRGWQVIRLANNFVPAPLAEDDIEALAEVVRRAAKQSSGANSIPANSPAVSTPSPNLDSTRTKPVKLRVVSSNSEPDQVNANCIPVGNEPAGSRSRLSGEDTDGKVS